MAMLGRQGVQKFNILFVILQLLWLVLPSAEGFLS